MNVASKMYYEAWKLTVEIVKLQTHLDPRRLETVVREAITGATATFSLSPQGGVLNVYSTTAAKSEQFSAQNAVSYPCTQCDTFLLEAINFTRMSRTNTDVGHKFLLLNFS